jgi:hypothetical protein
VEGYDYPIPIIHSSLLKGFEYESRYDRVGTELKGHAQLPAFDDALKRGVCVVADELLEDTSAGQFNSYRVTRPRPSGSTKRTYTGVFEHENFVRDEHSLRLRIIRRIADSRS